jgi:sugar phosphate isomerase/epimerase
MASGVSGIQFNFCSAGLPPLPEVIEPAMAKRVRAAVEARSLTMAAVSGTCNLIHPDPKERAKGVRRLRTLVDASPELGTSIVTLCTGTRDAEDMWRAHARNRSLEAWSDLRQSLEQVLPLAEAKGIVLGVEPEPANVIDSAPKAGRLLDEMRSPALKVVYDAANLLQPHPLAQHGSILAEAAQLLGPDIALAHAKDLASSDGPVSFIAAGTGVVNYRLVFKLLGGVGFKGAMILHSLDETEVPGAVAFLKREVGRTIPGSTPALLQTRFRIRC